MKRLFQRGERNERCHHADCADDDRAGFEAELAPRVLEEHRDRHHHAADEVWYGRGYRGAEVGAELFGGDGHENRPVSARKAERGADGVEDGGRRRALAEEERDRGDDQHEEHQHCLFAALQHLAQQAARQVAEDEAEVAEHHGVSGGDLPRDAKRRGEFGREGDEHADDEPDRHADEDRVQVAEKAGAAGEKRQEIAFADRRLVLHRLEHARLGDLEPRHQQQKTESAADEKGRFPVVVRGDGVGQNRAGDANRGDQHRAVAAHLRMQNLGDQRNARAQLSGQADARDEAQHGVSLQRSDETVGDVGQRVDENRAEHDLQPPLHVAEPAPQNATDQHSDHLHVEQKNAVVDQRLAFEAERLEARHAHDAEEHEIVNVNEVTKRGHDDRKRKNVANARAG